MSSMNVPGSAWDHHQRHPAIALFAVGFNQPLVFGTTMVVVWVGISLLFAGIAAISLAMQLKSAHKHLQKLA